MLTFNYRAFHINVEVSLEALVDVANEIFVKATWILDVRMLGEAGEIGSAKFSYQILLVSLGVTYVELI
jgi:hypothetical protein